MGVTRYKEFNIICDYCHTDGCYNHASEWALESQNFSYGYLMPCSEKGVRDMRKIAKEHGWLYTYGKDYCPKCQKKIVR